ncbi:MAG: hypothetical protein ACPGVK_01150, partial [Halocynthiibacter sp.]
MSKKFPWKGGFRSVPPKLNSKLSEIESDFIVVAATKSIARSEILDGLYAHIGIHCDGGEIIFDGSVAPPESAGKWSSRNAIGWDRPRKDWPKVQKTWTFEAPNFGDGARNGWSMRSRSQEVYQHQIFEPQGMMIEATLIEDFGGDKVVIKFAITPILSREMPEFELMLLWSINVLQENTGVTNIFSSDATLADFVTTTNLDWEIFPSGTAEQIIARLLDSATTNTVVDYERHVRERIDFFEEYEPLAYLRGHGGFGSYFGAQFADDFVVFENLRYGNAIYVLYENWVEVSQRSRLDLLRNQDAHFDRVIHTEGWQSRLG